MTSSAPQQQRRNSMDCVTIHQTQFTTIDETEAMINGGSPAFNKNEKRGGGHLGKYGGKGKCRASSGCMLEVLRNSKGRRASNKRDFNRMANVKTAAMLFVVTVVFIVTYLPAFLMALDIVPYSMVVFYMYFANNVANPVIYSFMNPNFREDTKRLFFRQRKRL